MYCQYFKPCLDRFLAFILLLILSPLLIVTMILVRTFLGAPIFFKQWRPGLNEKPFLLYKFRSMSNLRQPDGNLASDSERLTPFSKFLRSSSMDELPELINVLKGEMSLVGPRPLLMEYLPHYSLQQRLRHNVKPGITGWAQINGRNALNWNEKFKLDVWYAKNCSFKLDCKILLMSIITVIKRDGIHAEGHVTMTRFDDEVIQKKL